MDCFMNFCLGCDSQATEGIYCSEACRMADIERSSGSTPTSPINTMSSKHDHFHFVFPTALNLDYPPPPTKTPSFSDFTRKPDASYSSSHSHSQSAGATPQRILSPSTSRSSLTSNGTVVSRNDVDGTTKELLSYFNAFDRTRDQRRKSVPVAKQSHTWFVPESR